MNLLRKTIADVFAFTLAVGCVSYADMGNETGLFSNTVSAL